MSKSCAPDFQVLLVGLGLVLGLTLLLCTSASAQNLLRNGDFEQAPPGPTNWTVGHVTYDKPWISAASFDDISLTP